MSLEMCIRDRDYEYAATALLLNVGKMPKDAVIYIGSIKVYDADGNLQMCIRDRCER